MRHLEHERDFVVIGGGLSGLMAAITAARAGLQVALVQDRPVLGGNASKEIRVPPVGAVNCNFAYCRETGLIEEIYLENLYHNPTGNHEGWGALTQAYTQSPTGDGEGGNGYFSLDYGDAHILVLNTELSYANGSDQWNFAAADLAASTSMWKIVAFHKSA